MRLTATLLALALAFPAGAAPNAELRAKGDALRKSGDYAEALRTYEAERAAEGDNVEVWKRIGWTLKAMRRFGEAGRALEKATQLDPADREAQDDLRSLRASRGLRLSGWLGGDEPGTSKQAVNLEAWYGGLDRLELKAGYGYSDAIFFQSQKGFASAYWFYASDSYVQADLTWRQYSYPDDLLTAKPNPDTTSYKQAPRGTLELQHWFGRALRLTATYQVYAPNFWYDTSTRIVNHKATGELMLPLGQLRIGALAGALRDPDPTQTKIKGRPDPTRPPLVPGGPRPDWPFDTVVKYRVEPLFGGFVGWEADRWSLEVKGLTNRDLDASYDFSAITSLGLQPWDRTELSLAWVLDHYGTDSAYSGRYGNLFWLSGRYWVLPDRLALGGGVKWVNNPSPKNRTLNAGWRNDPTLLVNVEYRTGLF